MEVLVRADLLVTSTRSSASSLQCSATVSLRKSAAALRPCVSACDMAFDR